MIIEVGMIGAVMATGHDIWKSGTTDSPTQVILRAGETVHVIGDSPGVIIARMEHAKQEAKNRKYAQGIEVYLDRLPEMEGPDAD